jgi:hypothetical protein
MYIFSTESIQVYVLYNASNYSSLIYLKVNLKF